MIQASIVPVTPFQQNCSILWCENTKKAAVVDPGGDLDRILAAVAKLGVTVEKILITHGHIDHAGGTAKLARTLGVPIEGPQEEDRFWIESMAQQSKMFGFAEVESFEPDRWLHDGDTVTVGEQSLKVIHAPGHTPGHRRRRAVCWLDRPHRFSARRPSDPDPLDSRKAVSARR